jgi:hypothetical protein
MRCLWVLAACLCRWGVGEELWIDASFLTEKIDPKDADVVLVLPEDFENTATEEQLGIWDWWDDTHNDPKSLFKCDTFSLPRIPVGDPDYPLYLAQEVRWKKFFGTSRQGVSKGMGRIILPDGCV